MPEGSTALKGTGKTTDYLATMIFLTAIRFYKTFISPLKPRVCRFYPTCSDYTYEAITKYGASKGLLMGIKRIMSCHPFNPGGYRPVE